MKRPDAIVQFGQIMEKIATAELQTLIKSFFPVLYYLGGIEQFIRPPATGLFSVCSCTSALSVILEILAYDLK